MSGSEVEKERLKEVFKDARMPDFEKLHELEPSPLKKVEINFKEIIMQVKIADYLEGQLDHVYCDNCRHTLGDEQCTESLGCHRKYINWEASRSLCERLAKHIVENLLLNTTDKD